MSIRLGRAAVAFVVGGLSICLAGGVAFAQDHAASDKNPPAEIYKADADAKADIASALVRAKRDNQRVLIQYGANWCGWCHKLHALFKSDAATAKLLQYEYQVVLVDIGKMDKNGDITSQYGVDLKKAGVPYLTVLDADGKVIANQDTGALEAGDKHDPAKVQAFLKKNAAPQLDAQAVLSGALARAKSENKRLLVHFSAPWCGWCHKLEDWLAQPQIAALMAIDFVDLKIDTDRMTNADAVSKQLGRDEKGGIPWMVILDADGKALVNSNGPSGNIGYPAKPDEVGHFMKMIQSAARKLTAEQLKSIETSLLDAGKKLGG